MANDFPWKRFWRSREDSHFLTDRGFALNTDAEYGGVSNSQLFSFAQLQTFQCLVLLGEPGMGKSWSLGRDLGDFLGQPPSLPVTRIDLRSYGSEDRLYKALFESPEFRALEAGEKDLLLCLDSLDECLLRIDNVASMLADELPKHPIRGLRLIVACRTAAWPIVLEKGLKTCFGEPHFAAVELMPLQRGDVLQAAALSGIEDPKGFLTRIDHLGIAALASKPVTLKMLIEIFKREADLPPNVIDLYERGCITLCEEQNESRLSSKKTVALSPKERVATASRIAAITQYSNHFAIWTGVSSATPLEDVPMTQLIGGSEEADETFTINQASILETLGTGLFSSRGPERLGWSHQTFAEFLAARYCITHELSLAQTRSLLIHPQRHRVIPQMRGVASWIALQNDKLFREIVEIDAEALLGAPSASLSDDQRQILTDALLKLCDESDVLLLRSFLNLRNLAHPNLANQLHEVIRDDRRLTATRYFALKIVLECALASLTGTLLDIALSDTEATDVRTIAARAVAELGTKEERERLRPLLGLTREADPDDQLRAVALNAVYPGAVYDEEIWNFLEPPRNSNFIGSYQAFLSGTVSLKLDENNILSALQWCEKHSHDTSRPIERLLGEVCFFSVEHIEVDQVARLLAALLFNRYKSQIGFPERARQKKSVIEILEADADRRRHLLNAFLPLLTAKTAYFVLYPQKFIFANDLQWLIDRVLAGIAPCPGVETALINILASTGEPELVNAVWMACQDNEALAEECAGLFEVPWESVLSHRDLQLSMDRLTTRNKGPLASALQPRCEAVLGKLEAGQVDDWLTLTWEMSFDEGEVERNMPASDLGLNNLPGWTKASTQMRVRIIAAAKTYLTQTTFPETQTFPTEIITRGDSAGVDALILLQSEEPSYLQEQSPDFWKRWIRSLIKDNRTGTEDQAEVDSLSQIAAGRAPDEFNARLLEQIRFENSGPQRYLFCSRMIDRGWSDALALDLLSILRLDVLLPSVEAPILSTLLKHKVPEARDWAEGIMRALPQNDRGLTIATVLLDATDDAGWNVVWPSIQTNVTFGRALLEHVSYGTALEATSFTSKLTEQELGELYSWILEQYPPENDRRVSGAMGPRDTIRFLRDGILERLKRLSTFSACDSLSQTQSRLPQHRWLRYHIDEAEMLASATSWQPPSPREILILGQDRNKRYVTSSEQLLEVVLESLSRLQDGLHGELASVGALWNSDNGEWWPKEEEDISDFVAIHLRNDLVGRGIVVNREVQIRRGRTGEMRGQNTDIHIDTVAPKDKVAKAYGPIKLIVELKGSWNKKLRKDMKDQLSDRYLKNNDCRVGIYLVAHFKAERWRKSDWRRAKSDALRLEKLGRDLSAQAEELSGGDLLIRSFVLDARLDSSRAQLQ